MKSLLICHLDSPINFQGLGRWLNSFSELVGIVAIEEKGSRLRRRVAAEIRRSGLLGFGDVCLYRAYHRFFLDKKESAWIESAVSKLQDRYAPLPEDLPIHVTKSPNLAATQEFIASLEPDIVLARCKVLLKKSVYSVARNGTYVLHPGVCPEYRNAHGCFWALVNRDLGKVGMTLLRIDDGIDTGPIYGIYSYDFDEREETANVIMHKVVLENLEPIASKLQQIVDGNAKAVDRSDHASAVWGQPRLTKYLAWRRAVTQGR